MDLLRRVNAAVVLIFSNKFVIRCQSLHIPMKPKTYFWHPCSVYVFKSPEKGVYWIDKKLLTTSSLEQQDVIEQPTGLDLDLLKLRWQTAEDVFASRRWSFVTWFPRGWGWGGRCLLWIKRRPCFYH